MLTNQLNTLIKTERVFWILKLDTLTPKGSFQGLNKV